MSIIKSVLLWRFPLWLPLFPRAALSSRDVLFPSLRPLLQKPSAKFWHWPLQSLVYSERTEKLLLCCWDEPWTAVPLVFLSSLQGFKLHQNASPSHFWSLTANSLHLFKMHGLKVLLLREWQYSQIHCNHVSFFLVLPLIWTVMCTYQNRRFPFVQLSWVFGFVLFCFFSSLMYLCSRCIHCGIDLLQTLPLRMWQTTTDLIK